MRFTDRNIKALKPRDKRYDVFEDGRKGFGIRVSPTGGKSWIFVYRRNGKLSRVTIGNYPEINLADAHTEHARLRAILNKGRDPASVVQTLKHEQIRAPTVEQLVHVYLERHAKVKKRSWQEDERILMKDVVSRWGRCKAEDIKRRDIAALMDDIMDRGSPIAANRTLACVRKMFNYAVERSVLDVSPCVGLKAPGTESRRDRVLSEDEIQAFWQGLEKTQITRPIQLALKLQLVTAQRKGEMTSAEWLEFDLGTGWWTIPAEKTKNKLAHRVPLSPLALELLEQIKAFPGASRYVFRSPRDDKPMLPTSIDHAIRTNRPALKIEPFTPHDLRRTAASYMTGMGISRLVVSKVLNHAESHVTAVYDRHSYDLEKRQALDAWSRKLEAIISGKVSKVIRLRRGA